MIRMMTTRIVMIPPTPPRIPSPPLSSNPIPRRMANRARSTGQRPEQRPSRRVPYLSLPPLSPPPGPTSATIYPLRPRRNCEGYAQERIRSGRYRSHRGQGASSENGYTGTFLRIQYRTMTPSKDHTRRGLTKKVRNERPRDASEAWEVRKYATKGSDNISKGLSPNAVATYPRVIW
jgi:hypothetical protein